MLDELFGGPVATNDNKHKCERCSVQFFVTKPNRRFCSEKCRAEAAHDRYEIKRSYECEQCSSMFVPKRSDRTRFCCRRCAFDNFSDRAAIVVLVSFTVMRKLCECCGRRFDAKSTASRLCSDACVKVEARVKARAASVANDNVDRTPRPCAECAKVFSPAYGEKRNVYCSTVCAKRNVRRLARKKKRARLHTQAIENVNPIKVFERDKWKCQSCGVKTPRSLRGTYDERAPELDHIMPLSLGGAHSYMNTQCLCRRCNASKSDTAPSQPSLFAYAA